MKHDETGIIAILSCHNPEVKHMRTPMVRKRSLSGKYPHGMWNAAVFLVSCLAITVEQLVVSPLYMFYTAAMSYSYY